MSDETTRTDGWATADASSTGPGTAGSEASQAADASETVENAVRPMGFCQDCGRPLSPETLRAVGKAVFCEPCLETRLGQAPMGGSDAGAPPGYGAPAGAYSASAASGEGSAYSGPQPGRYTTIPPPVAPMPGEPSPGLAGFLGLIPGVGAMYNGQFAKGIVHLVIFVILVSMADNVSGIFWIFVWGWIFYQSFEAYHTAKAKLEGLPLPNAFGFNDVGERMGFGRSWGPVGDPGQPSRPATWDVGGTGQAGTAYGAPESFVGAAVVPPAGAAPPWTGSGTTGPVTTGPDWVGYVPPSAFAQADPRRQAYASAAQERAARDKGYVPPAYSETYTGQTPPAGYTTGPYAGPSMASVGQERRFPVGALWLIALGTLILLANLVPDWRITERWWPPLLFAGLSIWLFTRRLHSGARIACIVRWPAILMVLAVLSALHAAYFVVSFGMTCAVLLIAFGALLLVERTLGASGYGVASAYGAAPSTAIPTGHSPVQDPVQDPGRATFTAGAHGVNEPSETSDEPKGGQ